MKRELLGVRARRVRPGLDDKTLASWNALMIKAYVDAYNSFDEPSFIKAAVRNAELLLSRMRREDGGLLHSYKNGRATINGYLEDYALMIEALVSLYQATLEEKWLNTANDLAVYSIDHFFNPESRMFWFTSDLDPPLIARKMEVHDNVIPASNSSMAKGLFMLGHYFEKQEYIDMATQMLNNVKREVEAYCASYSNWGILMMDVVSPFYEIAIVGKSVNEKRAELSKHYIPHSIFAGSDKESELPLLSGRKVEGRTLIYVCENKTCQLPVTEVSEALKQVKNYKEPDTI